MIGSWINATHYGTYRAGSSVEYGSRTTLHDLGKTDGLFAYSVKNYGRFEPITQRVCCLTALALRDAGIEYGKDSELNIGQLATDVHGCAQSNYTYFKDYIDGGRKLARANLFIYTLPSSPIAEAAVHFGLQGPLLYSRSQKNEIEPLCKTAKRMLDEHQAEQMLLYDLTEDAGRCVLIGPDGEGLEGLKEWIAEKKGTNDEN